MNGSSPTFHVLELAKSKLGWIANRLSVSIPDDAVSIVIQGLSAAQNPKPDTLTFVQNAKKVDLQRLSLVAAVLCDEKTAELLPDGPVPLIVQHPHSTFAQLARDLYPGSLGNMRCSNQDGAFISPDAHIEKNVRIDTGAVIGKGVSIGEGSYVAANATVADHCQVGRNCSIGPSASLQYALLGDGVTIHAGARIGQDGFGFVPGAQGLEKMPQLGRVIIQDNVEIGANSTVDRGTLDDTVIGEGTKIDNLVQIGHNVVIGRNCAIAAFVGISGSTTIGDGCMFGGRCGISDHLNIGNGVQLAATSSVMNDIPDGEKWAGTPAQPFKAFFREQATLRRLAKPNKSDAPKK